MLLAVGLGGGSVQLLYSLYVTNQQFHAIFGLIISVVCGLGIWFYKTKYKVKTPIRLNWWQGSLYILMPTLATAMLIGRVVWAIDGYYIKYSYEGYLIFNDYIDDYVRYSILGLLVTAITLFFLRDKLITEKKSWWISFALVVIPVVLLLLVNLIAESFVSV
ncbi:MAG: hypothetical protein HKM24_04755 [Gammaproteobacteria bacterium]|nr:hypothetical protein [Gammaproteobacteria bacterium]